MMLFLYQPPPDFARGFLSGEISGGHGHPIRT
jgi:hypothetical protein